MDPPTPSDFAVKMKAGQGTQGLFSDLRLLVMLPVNPPVNGPQQHQPDPVWLFRANTERRNRQPSFCLER